MPKAETQNTARLPSRLAHIFKRFTTDTSGATAIEYGLIAGLMAVVCIASMQAVGNANGGGWAGMANKVITAMTK